MFGIQQIKTYVHKLGEVTVDIEGCGLDRELELVFDITCTEIQICAQAGQKVVLSSSM